MYKASRQQQVLYILYFLSSVLIPGKVSSNTVTQNPTFRASFSKDEWVCLLSPC